MKIKRCMVLLVLFWATLASAELWAQDALATTADQACECLSQIKAEGEAGVIEDAVQECIMQSFMANITPLMEAYGMSMEDLQDEDKGRKIGEDIAMQLFKDCPQFGSLMAKVGLEEEGDSEQHMDMVEGTFQGLTGKDLGYVKLKDNEGETQSFLFTYFSEAQTLLDNQKAWIGKPIEILWDKKKIYSAKEKKFISVRIIRSLSVKE